MQNIDRWRSNQFQKTHILNAWSNKTDANLEDSTCTVWVLLFFPKNVVYEQPLTYHSSWQKESSSCKRSLPKSSKLVFKHLLYLKEMRLELRTAASQSVCESFFVWLWAELTGSKCPACRPAKTALQPFWATVRPGGTYADCWDLSQPTFAEK